LPGLRGAPLGGAGGFAEGRRGTAERIGLALDLPQRRQHVRVFGITLEDAFVLENRRRKLAHRHVGLGDALGGVDHVLFTTKLGVSFLENFEGLIVLRLRLSDHLEHLNRLRQLSLFAAGELAGSMCAHVRSWFRIGYFLPLLNGRAYIRLCEASQRPRELSQIET
jgi:hypothetical protein